MKMMEMDESLTTRKQIFGLKVIEVWRALKENLRFENFGFVTLGKDGLLW